jgi:hypothetical protein
VAIEQDFHFWIGSVCRDANSSYPANVIAASDILTVTEKTKNPLPDRSWMLYLFEFFLDRNKEIPVELDLISSFDGNDRFTAVFGGNNQYEFTMPLIVGHSYIREIVIDPSTHVIDYLLADVNTGISESFNLSQKNLVNMNVISNTFQISSFNDISFEGADHFTGLEWHNKKENSPFAIPYHARVSLLQHGILASADKSKHPAYIAYKSIQSDKDDSAKKYPVSFENINVIKGCISYSVKSGSSINGMEYRF